MKPRWILLGVLALTLVLALPASALTNWLGNGDFESADISMWYAFSGNSIFTRIASPTHTGSGALEITSKYDLVCQCVSLTGWPAPGGARYYAADGYLQSNNTNEVYIDVDFYSDECDSADYTDGPGSNRITSDSWALVTIPYQEIPTTATHAEFCVYTGDDFTYYADDLQFYPTTSTAVTLRSLAARNAPWGAGLVGALALGGLLLLGAAAVVVRKRRG